MGAIPEIQLPDSELCRASIEYARAVSEPFLFHHVMRSAIYADQIGRARGFQYDREVLCVSAVLHDLGLTRVAPVEARFEVEGADAAKEFLARQGMSERNPKAAMSHVVADTCERRVTGFRRFNFCDHLAETNRRIVQRTQAREGTHASHE